MEGPQFESTLDVLCLQKLWFMDIVFVTLHLPINKTLKDSQCCLPSVMQESLWWWQCSVRYSLPLPPPPGILVPPPPPPSPYPFGDKSVLNKLNQTKAAKKRVLAHTRCMHCLFHTRSKSSALTSPAEHNKEAAGNPSASCHFVFFF